jgi:PAS domain S-box-containing protein
MTNAQRTILIIDSSEESRARYRQLLQSQNQLTYQITESTSEAEALKLCQQQMPDAILLDERLLDLEGLEFLHQLKLQTDSPIAPVIMLVEQEHEALGVQTAKDGAQDYLFKQKLTPELLCRTIEHAIERLSLLRQLEQSQEQQRRLEATLLQTSQPDVLTNPLQSEEGNFSPLAERANDIHDRQQAEAALKTAEAKYRSIVENAVEGIFQTTPEGYYLSVNPALAKMHGFESAVEMMTSLTDISQQLYVDPARRRKFTRLMQEQGIVRDFESQVYRKDGSIIWISENVRSAHDAAGNLLYYEGSSLDITQRKQAEAALKQHQEFLQAVIETTPNLIFVRDWEGRYLLVNKAFADLHNISVEEFAGKKDEDFYPDLEAVHRFWQENQQVIQTQEPLFIPEEKVFIPGVGELWFQWYKQPIYLPESRNLLESRTCGVLGIGINITARKQAETALKSLIEGTASAMGEDFFPALVRYIASALDVRHAIVSELVDDRFHTLAFWSDHQLQVNLNYSLAQTPCEITLEQGIYHHPAQVQQAFPNDPDLVTLEAESYLGVALLDANGQPLGHLCILDSQPMPELQRFEGILRVFAARATAELERKRATEALRQLNLDLELRVAKRTEELVGTEEKLRTALAKEKELNELKSRFVSMISHEFRTPLTTIQSAAELLQYYRWSDEEQQERFQQIHAAVQHMTQMLEDVLLIGKAEAGKLEFNPKLLDLTALCQQFVADLQLSANHQYQITFTSQGQANHAWIDQTLLRLIVSNLLSNAIKYSPENGNVELSLDYDSDYVILRISDEGIGIPQIEQQRLFEAFYRGTNVGTIQGTGLGLTTVKRCVDLHQGTITLASRVNVGTIFTVTLPLTCKP